MAQSLFQRLRTQPLVLQFLIAGAAVMLAAMLVIGTWITARIEQSVVDNTSSAAALYLGSFVAPISQELAANETLSEPAQRALRESFESSGLAERVVAFRIWKPGSLVIYAIDPEIIGKRFEPTEELKAGWSGRVSGNFASPAARVSVNGVPPDVPLLHVYAPLREVWSGRIIAVAEFYEIATDLRRDLANARLMSWLLVASVFFLSGILLLGIVRAGGHTISEQEAMLREQIEESRRIAVQNGDLRRRAIGASARATAQAERSLRRVSADLHDGPAQYVALAAMRLDSMVPATPAGQAEAATIRGALQTRPRRDPRDLARACRCPTSNVCASTRSSPAPSTATGAAPTPTSTSATTGPQTRASTPRPASASTASSRRASPTPPAMRRGRRSSWRWRRTRKG